VNGPLKMGIYLVVASRWSSEPTSVIRRAGRSMRTYTFEMTFPADLSSWLNWLASTPWKFVKMAPRLACKAARNESTKPPEDMAGYAGYGKGFVETRTLEDERVLGT
jgi:hypothetical protein